MPKKKNKKPAKKNTKVKTTSPSSSPAVVVASRTIASLPALTEVARSAFLGQTRAQERADLGGKTKSAGVLREAGAWIPIIARAKAAHGAAIAYSEARLAFLCESVLALSDAAMTRAREGCASSSARRPNDSSSASAMPASAFTESDLNTDKKR